jgi:hypothetical protein
MDKGKITYISRLPHGEQIVMHALSEQTPVSITELADRFGVEEMFHATKNTTFLVSLLYYFGVLTLTDQRTELENSSSGFRIWLSVSCTSNGFRKCCCRILPKKAIPPSSFIKPAI